MIFAMTLRNVTTAPCSVKHVAKSAASGQSAPMPPELRAFAARGGVWILVGIAIFAYGWIAKSPIIVRGTHVPFGWLVILLGVVIGAWDVIKLKRKKPTAEG
jgi:hypothetical protein